jgi:hypothetical protein
MTRWIASRSWRARAGGRHAGEEQRFRITSLWQAGLGEDDLSPDRPRPWADGVDDVDRAGAEFVSFTLSSGMTRKFRPSSRGRLEVAGNLEGGSFRTH